MIINFQFLNKRDLFIDKYFKFAGTQACICIEKYANLLWYYFLTSLLYGEHVQPPWVLPMWVIAAILSLPSLTFYCNEALKVWNLSDTMHQLAMKNEKKHFLDKKNGYSKLISYINYSSINESAGEEAK